MPHRKLDRHLGARGWILLLCSWVWALVGLGVWLRAAKDGDPTLLHLYLPTEFRVILWLVPAAAAVYGAFRKKHLVVVLPLLIVAPLIRVGSYLWGWITALVFGADEGYLTGWYSAAMHAPLIFLVLIAAHIKEQTRDEVK